MFTDLKSLSLMDSP